MSAARRSHALGSPILGGCRLALYLLVTGTLAPLQMLLCALDLGPIWRGLRWRVPRLYHRLCARVVGLELEVRGVPSAERPTLFVSNHSSYLDITVLGALIEGSFVAKTEVGTWPFFGTLAKLQRTVFVDRRVRSGAGRQRDELRTRLEQGDSLILFPEGTSSDGNRTLPFKTALFSVADTRTGGRPVTVQPVSVTATRLDGIPLGHWMRPVYAWYGDMDLVPHLWNVFRLGRITVVVEFHEPVTVARFNGSRKALADHSQRTVAQGVARAVAGRLDHVAATVDTAPPPDATVSSVMTLSDNG